VEQPRRVFHVGFRACPSARRHLPPAFALEWSEYFARIDEGFRHPKYPQLSPHWNWMVSTPIGKPHGMEATIEEAKEKAEAAL
jgi:hypothetical protein